MNDRTNRRVKSVSRLRALFFLLFLAIGAFLVYDVLVVGPSLSMNSYNPRLEDMEAGTVRGTITDRNGIVLAETKVEEDVMIRVYPYSEAFAQTIGYVGQGKAGVEETYNLKLLTSHETLWDKFLSDLTERRRYGDNLKMTLDSSLQLKSNELLEGKYGAVVAIEPSTGRILVLASQPGFNPNTITDDYNRILEDTEGARLLNRASQGLYPPGSTFKVLTSLAYMNDYDEADFHYDCTGSVIIDGKEINCYDNTSHGLVDLSKAFAYSCNTAYATISTKVSMETMNELTAAFGFNKGLPYLPVSSVSRFGTEGGPGTAEWAETLIGQGRTMISPLHNALIAATIANGGRMMAPYLLDSIFNHKGDKVDDFLPVMASEPITASQVAAISSMMERTVLEGTAQALANDNYSVAGKTGSAENPSGAAHGWFIGFAPVENPRIAIAVIVEHGGSGSASAVPIAKAVFDTYFNTVTE